MKKLCIALAFMLMVSLCSFNVTASENMTQKGEDVEKYIKEARRIFGVSTDYDNIDADSYDGTVNIYWSYKDEEDGSHKSESVSFTEDGRVIRYSINRNENRFVRSSIVEKDIIKSARDYLKKMYPDTKDVFFISDKKSYNKYHTIVFGVKRNGVTVYDAKLRFEFFKSDSKLSMFYANAQALSILNSGYSVHQTKSVKEKVASAFKEAFPLKLVLSNINDEYKPFYTIAVDNPMLDEKTLKPLENKDMRLHHYDDMKEEAKAADSADGIYLSKAEQDEIKKIKSGASVTEARKKAAKLFGLDDKNFKSLSLYKRYKTQDYIYRLQYSNGEDYLDSVADIVAKDLKPISFHRPFADNDKALPDTNTVAKKSDELIKALNLEGKYELFSANTNDNSTSRVYYKKLDEYMIEDDSLCLVYDSNGLQSYSLSEITDEIKFEKKKLDADKAYELILGEHAFELYIVPIFGEDADEYNASEYKLVYALAPDFRRISAIDGKTIYGEEEHYLEMPVTDEKHKALITDLYDNGFGVAIEKTLSDKLTRRDLIMNLANCDGYTFMDIDELIKKYRSYDIFTKENLDKPFKSQEMIKLLILNKFNLKSGELDDSVFPQGNADKGYRAYITIARSLGWTDDKFDGKKEATVLDGALLLEKVLFK